MGIPERRVLKQFEEQEYPKHKQAINAAAGFDVPLTVDWASMELDGESALYMNAIPKVYFIPLADAFRSIASDELGKSALKNGLKSVTINGKEGTTPTAWRFESGELRINHICIYNIEDVKDRANWLIKTLEDGLLPGMGLKEMRAMTQFKETAYPDWKKKIDAAAGFDVAIDVAWDTLAAKGYSHLYSKAFPNIYFIPLVDAFMRIAPDDFGKDALKAGLKKIIINGSFGSKPSNDWSFSDGILTINHRSDTNVDSVSERTDWLARTLEKAL